jgi:hypothetical protein
MPSEKKVIAVRLDEALTTEIEALATADQRSAAQMTAIFIQLGMRLWKENGNKGPVVGANGTLAEAVAREVGKRKRVVKR